MTVADKILAHLQHLPQSEQQRVWDFVQKLESEDAQWSADSISQAMRGMENEEVGYDVSDWITDPPQPAR